MTITSDLVVGGGTVNAKVPIPGGSISNGSTGLIDVNPWLEVNYHRGPLFVSTGLAVWLPWGTYNKNEVPVKGLGQNRPTFAPLLYLTYLATPKIQLDLASVTEFNTINPHTQYTSGSDQTFTASASSPSIPNLQIGPTAYFYGQFSNDTQKGVTIPKGNRSQALGVGLQGIYTIGHGALLLKYYHQTLVQNRPGGNRFWLIRDSDLALVDAARPNRACSVHCLMRETEMHPAPLADRATTTDPHPVGTRTTSGRP